MGKKYEHTKIKNLIKAVGEYKSNLDFRMVLDEIFAGAELTPHTKHRVPLKGYNTLIKTQKDKIREVARLLYSGRLWNQGSNITLTRLENNELVNNYINTFIHGIDETWYMIHNVS